jgi:osmotically-inducible protein OsmY
VAGVRNMHNHLQVVLPDEDYRDDAILTTAANNALDRSALVDDDSDVSVDTSGNTVTLRGHVRTWAERDAMVGAAWMAGGVMQVRDDIDIIG